MFDNLAFWLLFAAYTIAWLALGGYVFSIDRRQKDLNRSIDQLESLARTPHD